MAAESLPGRCGNLSDQEAIHLRDIWGLLLNLFEQDPRNPELTATLAQTRHGGLYLTIGRRSRSPSPSSSSITMKETKFKVGYILAKVRGKQGSTNSLSLPSPEDSSDDNNDPSVMPTSEMALSVTPPMPLDEIVAQFSGAQLREAFWNLVATDNPDAILLRFLRARKWDVQKAFHMCCATLKWRIEEGVDELLALGEAGIAEKLEREDPGQGAGFWKQLDSGKSFLGGPDKAGRPICFINVSLHHKDDQTLETLKKFTIYVMETTRLFAAQPIDTACVVFNMTDFSLSHMDMDYVKFLISCFEAYYPESLGVCLVHRAPWIFSTVWKVISPLLDPVVASKIHFTKMEEDLFEYIAPSSLPVSLGGTDLTEYVYLPPVPGESLLTDPSCITEKEERLRSRRAAEAEFEGLTQRWVAGAREVPDAEEWRKRKELAKRLRKERLKLDPYMRAKTYYHRKGIIKETREGRLLIDWGHGEGVLDLTERV